MIVTDAPNASIRARLITSDQTRFLTVLAQVSTMIARGLRMRDVELAAAIVMAEWIASEERAGRIKLDRQSREAIRKTVRDCQNKLEERLNPSGRVIRQLREQGLID